MKKALIIVAAIALIICSAGLFLAYSAGFFATDPFYTTENGAIDGYDPVAFFETGVARRGSAEITADYAGVEWRFVDQATRNQFLAAPESYVPQYGGYCAYAMADGYTAYANPENWAIVDGRLFLNYDADVQQDWQQDRSGMIARADAKWPMSGPGSSAPQH